MPSNRKTNFLASLLIKLNQPLQFPHHLIRRTRLIIPRRHTLRLINTQKPSLHLRFTMP
ncbi:hypothetical protein HanRHA438_Chr15g0707311 [Helianthus annuus]|nr:hypothetical protein HanRHA438_Chr15g0707311 [Helianthus annuus]